MGSEGLLAYEFITFCPLISHGPLYLLYYLHSFFEQRAEKNATKPSVSLELSAKQS